MKQENKPTNRRLSDGTSGTTAASAKVDFPPEPLKEWGKVMIGHWRSQPPAGAAAAEPEIHSSAQWILNNTALQGEFQVGGERGLWITVWNVESKQIEQRTVNSDGSTVFTIIKRQGDHWEWRQIALYPNGENETSIDTVKVSSDGNTLEHNVSHRVRNGNRLPNIHSILNRASA